MLRPPKTNDPALNRFLEEVANTIQDRVRPEEGWTLSDFASSVSEVISDKRDLIDIVTKYDNIEGLSEEMEAAVDLLKSDIQDSMDLLSSVNSKSAEFAEVMEWWDQNYKVIFDAQEAMEIFGEISSALEGHQDILDQIAAATEVAENVVTEVKAAEASAKAAEEAAKAAEEAAKTSETNASDAAARAEASETAAGESRDVVVAVHQSLKPGGEILENLNNIGSSVEEAASQARDDRDAATASATAAQGSADRAESAAAGVDQVVSDAAGVLAGEIADDLAAAQTAKSDAEAARDEAAESATLASTNADEAAASAATADGRATDAESAVASIAGHATDAEGAAGRAAVSESNAAGSATAAASSATDAQGHADRAATEAGAAAQIAAQEKIAQLVGDAPANLDTIYELADAFEDRGDAIAAIQDALANRVMGNHSSVISSTVPGAGTPTNQVTFVVEGI